MLGLGLSEAARTGAWGGRGEAARIGDWGEGSPIIVIYTTFVLNAPSHCLKVSAIIVFYLTRDVLWCCMFIVVAIFESFLPCVWSYFGVTSIPIYVCLVVVVRRGNEKAHSKMRTHTSKL